MIFSDARLDELGKAYLISCEKRGLSRVTLYNYERSLRVFADLTFADWEAPDFVDSVHERLGSMSPATVNNHLAILKTFDSWLFYEGHTSVSHNFRRPKAWPKIRELPSDDEVRRLTDHLRRRYIEAPIGYRFARWREWTATAVLFETGMRIGEAKRLKVRSMIRDKQGRGGLFVDFGKTSSATRVCPISDGLYEALWTKRGHMSDRDTELFRDPEPRGGMLHAGPFSKRIRDIAAGLKIPAKITPHVARHKFIFDWIAGGGTAFGLMARIGHASPDQTIYYFNQVRRLFPYAELSEDFGILAMRSQRPKPTRQRKCRIAEATFTPEQLEAIQRLIDAGVIPAMEVKR